MSGVGNDCSARRVVSTALAARTTTAPWASDRNRRWPPASTSTVCTVPPVACSLTTCASGTRNRRLAASFPPDAPTSARMASTSTGRLLYLSKLKRPDTGGLPCTASGAVSTPLVPIDVSISGVAAAALTHALRSTSPSSPKMKSVAGTTPISLSTSM